MEQREQVHVEVGDPRRFVRRILQQSGSEPLFDTIDQLPQYTRAAELVVTLAQAGGGKLRDSGTGTLDAGHNLQALWGGKYFIDVPGAIWTTILASLSMIVSIAAAQANPTGYAAAGVAALNLVESLRKIPKKLQPEDIPVFLATALLTVGGAPAKPELLAQYLRDNHPDGDQWTIEKVQRIADMLAAREILKRVPDGFLV